MSSMALTLVEANRADSVSACETEDALLKAVLQAHWLGLPEQTLLKDVLQWSTPGEGLLRLTTLRTGLGLEKSRLLETLGARKS